MTTSPSWFPAWPSSFPDLESTYAETIPRQFPEGLYDNAESDEYKDIQAMAVVFSWVAQGGEWIKRRIFPQFDTGAMFLHLWESCFGIAMRATTTLRQNAIIAHMRYMRGTATKEQLQAIFAPIFGTADPSDIEFSYCSLADAVTAAPDTQAGWNQILNTLHIYSACGNVPDWDALWDTIRAVQPTWQRWGGGSYKQLKWDTQGGWDTACWGP